MELMEHQGGQALPAPHVAPPLANTERRRGDEPRLGPRTVTGGARASGPQPVGR